ncbi:MAG: FtsX-like permease family protein [Chloroflexi bacterium]|nr:FtsX-like permease family protein [Chloroflexota bacterium]
MTRLLFVKLFRDLRGTWARIVLMILAMSITLVMFSAVLYTWGVTGREMPRAYLSTDPASATIWLKRGLNADEMAAIAAETRQQPGIFEATARTQYTLQVQQEDGGWGPNPLQIFVAAPDDPMRIENFIVEQGSWPPAAGEILIDRSSFDLLNLEVGGVVIVQAPNGAPTSLRISGVVYDPALAPSFQEQKGHGFMSAASLPVLGEPVALDALKIQVADQPGLTVPSRNRDVIVATALNLADWLQQTYGVAILEIQIPAPYAHPHQAQADSLLLGLLVFGVAGLLLSAILVATMLNGLFTQQIPQIGIMKAIGARSGRVLQLYLLMTLVIAVASTALAIVPGIFISRVFAPIILTLLGVEAESLTAPSWMYVVVIIAGVGVPLLFALASLVKTSRTTVREALDYHGVNRRGDIATRFDAGLGRLRGLDRTVLMAFRNIFRRRARFLLSVGLLASAGAVFVAGVSTMSGFQASLDRDKELRWWDVEVRLAVIDQVSADVLTSLVTEIPNVTRVEGWSTVQTSVIPPGQQINVTRTYPDQGHGSISVTVVPPDSALIVPPSLLEGRWLRPDETGSVVISQAKLTEGLSDIRSGDTIQLSIGGRLTSWQVVGIAESVGGHGGGFFITQDGFEAATGVSQPNLLRIVTDNHDEETRTAVATMAERTLTDAGIVVRSAASVSRSAAAGAGHMLPLILVFLGLSIAMGVVGFAGLASTMSTNVLERTREFGVMSAIGAPASTVRRLVVLEGIFIAVISCMIAAIPAPLLTVAMIDYLPMSGIFQISISGVVIWVVVVVIGAALATLAPASQASRLTVREALTYL